MRDKSNDINSVIVELMLTTAGGKIVCRRCSAMSKRTNVSAVGQLLRASQSVVFMEGDPLAQRLNWVARFVLLPKRFMVTIAA